MAKTMLTFHGGQPLRKNLMGVSSVSGFDLIASSMPSAASSAHAVWACNNSVIVPACTTWLLGCAKMAWQQHSTSAGTVAWQMSVRSCPHRFVLLRLASVETQLRPSGHKGAPRKTGIPVFSKNVWSCSVSQEVEEAWGIV